MNKLKEIEDLKKQCLKNKEEALCDILEFDEDFVDKIYKLTKIKNSNKLGCVYFIKNKYTNLIKIGKSDDVNKRLSNLNSMFKSHFGCDQALSLVATILAPFDSSELEKEMHNEFKEERVFGEWFDISEEQISNQYFFDNDFFETFNKNFYIAVYDKDIKFKKALIKDEKINKSSEMFVYDETIRLSEKDFLIKGFCENFDILEQNSYHDLVFQIFKERFDLKELF